MSEQGVTELKLAPGSLIGGRYRIVRLLGQGGMGAIYLGEREGLGGAVAIKVLLPQARSAEHTQRFRREATVLSHLHHPNVVEMYDFGQQRDFEYLVLEYVAGRSLQADLAAGPLPWPRALTIARRIAQALAAAHRLGLVHRDLKPGNVMLIDHPGEPDHVKVLDFGIAKIFEQTDEFRTGSDLQTQSGTVIGTPKYMAPEQVLAGQLDGRADLYALGIILFEMLTGHPPFTGLYAEEILRAQVSAPIPPLAAPTTLPPVPAEVQQLVRRLLGKTVQERPDGAEALLVELDAILQHHGLTLSGSLTHASTRAKGPMPGVRKPGWPWPARIALVLGLAMALVLGAGVALQVWRTASAVPDLPDAQTGAATAAPETGVTPPSLVPEDAGQAQELSNRRPDPIGGTAGSAKPAENLPPSRTIRRPSGTTRKPVPPPPPPGLTIDPNL